MKNRIKQFQQFLGLVLVVLLVEFIIALALHSERSAKATSPFPVRVEKANSGLIIETLDQAGDLTEAGSVNVGDDVIAAGDLDGSNVNATASVTAGSNVTAALTVTATGGYWLPSNGVAAWPASGRFPGDAFVGQSNGVVYLLTSTTTSSAWAAKTKLGP